MYNTLIFEASINYELGFKHQPIHESHTAAQDQYMHGALGFSCHKISPNKGMLLQLLC